MIVAHNGVDATFICLWYQWDFGREMSGVHVGHQGKPGVCEPEAENPLVFWLLASPERIPFLFGSFPFLIFTYL